MKVCLLEDEDLGIATYDSEHCGKDKRMSSSWSLNWESLATREREAYRGVVGNLLVVYVCLPLLSVIDAKGQFLCP